MPDNRGYVSLDRSLLHKHIFKNEKLLKTWIWCLLKANHDPAYIETVGLQRVPLKSGQFITGRFAAAEELGLKPSTAWKHLKELERNQSIEIKSNNKFSVITLINWEFYQIKKYKSNSKMTTKRQQNDTNNNNKDIGADPSSAAGKKKVTIIDYYHDKFVEKFGEKPHINGGKDGGLMKKVASTYGEARAKELLDVFFESRDPFIQQSGYTIGVFYSQINKLLTVKKRVQSNLREL